MPRTFKIRDKETGKVFTIREKELPSTSSSVEDTRPVDPILPGKNRVQDLISARPNPVDSLLEETSKPFDFSPAALLGLKGPKSSPALKTLVTGAKTIGTGAQLLEGGLSNAGLAIQEGDFSPKRLLDEFVGGVSGRKPAQFGDLVRNVGVGGIANEAIASTVGFAAAIAATNLATKGKIVEGANKVSRALKARSAAKAADKKFFFKNRADQLSEGADDVVTGVRHEFDSLYNKIGNNKIGPDDAEIVRGAKDLISPSELKRFARELKVDPKVLTDKVDDLNKVKSLKGIIGRSVPKNVWSGIDDANPKQTELINKYHDLSDIIARNAGNSKDELLKLNAKYKEVLNFRQVINSITKVKSTGVTKSSTLKNIRSDSNQGNLAELEDFSNKFFPKTKEILRDIDKQNKNQKLIKVGKDVLVKGGSAAVGFKILESILDN